jgi:hypothetical protein
VDFHGLRSSRRCDLSRFSLRGETVVTITLNNKAIVRFSSTTPAAHLECSVTKYESLRSVMKMSARSLVSGGLAVHSYAM